LSGKTIDISNCAPHPQIKFVPLTRFAFIASPFVLEGRGVGAKGAAASNTLLARTASVFLAGGKLPSFITLYNIIIIIILVKHYFQLFSPCLATGYEIIPYFVNLVFSRSRFFRPLKRPIVFQLLRALLEYRA